MRIAYVINSTEGGGAAFPVPAVTRVLRSHGCEVELFALTPRDGRALPPMHESGLVTHVRAGGEKDHLAAYGWLHAHLSAWEPDVIWTSLTRATLLGQLVGQRLKIPVVSWQHAAYLKPANKLLLRARTGASALWIADSHSVRELTATRLNVPPDRLMLWPLFAADAGAPQAQPWRPGEPVRIGTLGRLHPVKGFDVLVAALARLGDARLDQAYPFEVEIAGEGDQREALSAAIARAGLSNVRLAGFTDRPRTFLSSLHLYVQPSRSEGLCIAAHEAMQAGLPTVVSAVGELPHSVVDGETGLVTPPDDPERLAQALAWLLSNPDRLAEMGAAGRKRVLDRFGRGAFERAGAEIIAWLPAIARRPAAARPGSPTPRTSGRPA
jgi:glycosyltransferase involved in cell wall biosynthesis